MWARKQKSKGFTLVEILIVVVILGILAAIVIPQFTNASETAKASSLISQLQTIRSQLELFQVQHNGNYPDIGTNWDRMTSTTNVSGTVGTGAGFDFGPYLQKAPVNPFMNASTVNQVTGASTALAAGTAAWAYNQTNGQIKAVIPAAKWTDLESLGLGSAADVAGTSNSDVIKGPAQQ
jgi:general secretion pathway protein G